MYRFYIKNYMGSNSQKVTTEDEVYSVPITDPDLAFAEPCIKNEMGKAGTFEFTIYPNHPFFNSWLQMITLLRVEYDGDTIFRGRVITVDNTMWGSRKIHAEGDLAFLLDSQQEGIKDDNRPEITALAYLQQLISNHNSQMGQETDKHFTLGEVPGQYSQSILPEQKVKTDTRKYGSSSWQNTMSALENLQKTFGGFFRTRYQNGTCYLDWLDNYYATTVNPQPMEIAQNLIDISDTSEVENIFTILIPVGSLDGENLYLSEKAVDVSAITNYFSDNELNFGYHRKSDYLNAKSRYGSIYKVENFKNADTEAKLREYCMDYIRHNYTGGVSTYTISALDMHHTDNTISKYLEGDRVRVIYPDPDNMENGHSGRAERTLTVISITYYPHKPDANEYSVGIPESQTSKEYGLNKNKKTTLSKTNADGNVSISSGISSLSTRVDQPQEVTEVVQKKVNYEALAWTFINDNTGKNFYDHTAYNNLTSSYPNAQSQYNVTKMGQMLIYNKLTTNNFGKFEYGPFKINCSEGTIVHIGTKVGSGITDTTLIRKIQAALQAYVDGYIAYKNAHPEWPGGNDVISTVTSLLNGDGLQLFSSGSESLLLPAGLDIIGQGGQGISISGASSLFTNILSDLGISTTGGVLSEENLKKFLDKTNGINLLIDSKTGKFSLDAMLSVFPRLKDSITNGTFTKSATDWLLKKIPFLKYALGSGQTQLTTNGISDLISNIPLFAPEKMVNVSSESGVISGTGVNVGDGAATVGADGTITLAPTLISLLDANGHVTQASLIKVFPRLENSFSSGQSNTTLSKAASNHVIKKFPELAAVRNNDGQLTFSAIETYINQQIAAGKLKNTVNPTTVIDANTGEVKATGVELGADAEADPTVKMDGDDGSMALGDGTTDKVELNGWDGIQYLGKDANGNWLIQMNEPIEYTDSSGISHTVPAGTIGAKDFYLDEIPSFHTKFAVIDQAIINSATIGQLQAAEARITSLETNTVKTNELYVQGTGQFAGFIKATAGIDARTGYIHTKYLYTNNDSYVYGNAYFNNGVQLLNADDDDYDQIIGATARFGNVTKRIAGTGDFRIGLKATENNDGTISIAFINDPNGDNVTANFKIAATQKYINDVAAIKQAVKTALNASGAGSWSDGTKSLYVGLYIDSVNKKVKVGTAEAKIQYPGENVTTLSLALPINALDLSTFYDNAYDDGADDVYFSSESLWSDGSKTLTLSNNKTKTITIPNASSHSSAKIGKKTYSLSCIIGGKSFTFSDIDTTESYNAGHDDAESSLTTFYTSANGTFTAPFGYYQVEVNVANTPSLYIWDYEDEEWVELANDFDYSIEAGSWQSMIVNIGANERIRGIIRATTSEGLTPVEPEISNVYRKQGTNSIGIVYSDGSKIQRTASEIPAGAWTNMGFS